MQPIIRLINGYRLRRKLRNMETIKDKREVVRKAARASARPLHSAIKTATPVRTGLLKGSVKIRAIKKSRIRVGVNVIIRAIDWKKAVAKKMVKGNYGKRKHGKTYKIFYGSFVEMGTHKIKPRRFMKRTAKRMGKSVQMDMMNRTFQLIKNLAK